MAEGDPDFSQLSALVSSFQQQQQQQPQQQLDPLVVDPADTSTNGMSFHELFSHYLAPEVAKLPQSSTAPAAADPLAFTFGDDQATNAVAGPSSASTFDPSTFMPTIPGSPVGAFSPSSDGNSSHRSPMSFPDLDFSATSDPFALDPSIFGVSAGLDYGMPVDAMDSSLTYTPATSAASETPLSVLPNAPLPPLPSLYLETASTSAPVEQQQVSVAPPPAAAAAELTASGRPKRNVAHSILDADEEDDDVMYSSDASNATTTRRASARGSSRKPSAAKKARASSSGASDAAAAAAHASAAAAEAKRLARTSVVPLASSDLHKTTANSKLPPVPQWADKPDPDEYQKLSSKEKRQMRNKISARNFRHRRKEYITTLEDEISSRDTIISELRDEVGVIRAENSGLRTEVATLKEKWQDLLDKLSSLSGTPVAAPAGTAAAGLGTNPPRAVAAAAGSSSAAPLAAVKEEEGDVGSISAQPSSSSASAAASRRIGTRSGGVARPNLTKDVSALGRRGATGSWATAGGFGGGFTSVHTTLLPDVNLADGLHGKPSLPPFATQSFNPALNALSANQLAGLPAMTAHLRTGGLSAARNGPQPQPQPHDEAPKGTFEDFFASNPYWLRPDQLDQSRAALYGKLANNAAGLVAAQAKSPQQDGYLPVPAGFTPSFFRSASASSPSSSPTASSASSTASTASPNKSSTAAELLAFQSPATAYALGVSHQDATLASAAASEQHAALMTAARVATLARETLASRMWSAFVDAFSGPAVGPGAEQQRGAMSADKVAAVLGGRARVEVVPVVAAPAPVQQQEVDALGERMGGVTLARAASPVGASGADERECGFEGVVGRWLSGGAAPKRA